MYNKMRRRIWKSYQLMLLFHVSCDIIEMQKMDVKEIAFPFCIYFLF